MTPWPPALLTAVYRRPDVEFDRTMFPGSLPFLPALDLEFTRHLRGEEDSYADADADR